MIALLLLVACGQSAFVEGSFHGPDGVAMIHPGQGGPFYEPVALVANSRSGRIVPLDVKHGQLLADDPAAPFLAASPIPTGADRILGEIVAWTPDAETVTAYVADARTRSLLEVPWIVGLEPDGSPAEREAILVGEPEFIDADGSGDAGALIELVLHPRGATSETWTLTFDGQVWRVEGSRSGRQASVAQLLQPYRSDEGILELTISGTATEGDQIVFTVDRGVVEHELEGYVEALLAVPQAGVILASVYDPDLELGQLLAFDPAAGAVLGALDLPDGAHPGRMAVDVSGDLIYVVDLKAALAYEILLDPADPLASATRSIEMPAPLVDLAWQGDADYEHLFVAPQGDNGYRVYDLAADAWLDLNPATEEIDGIDLRAPITGLAAGLDPVRLPELSDWGARAEQRVVAISSFEGVLFVAEGATGCLARDESGPYAAADSDSPFVDDGASSDPSFYAENALLRGVSVNACAGIVRDERWTVTFDEADGSWVVSGSVSDIQEGRAYEDTRYVSDGGEISFLILAGLQPSTEGDQLRFNTFDGVASVSGDINGDNFINTASGEIAYPLPARPVPYSYLSGPTGGGWDEVNRKVGVIWPIVNGDRVMRVNLESVAAEIRWD